MAAPQRAMRKRVLSEIALNSSNSESDFDSDDSIMDKNYVVSGESSGSESMDDLTVSLNQ